MPDASINWYELEYQSPDKGDDWYSTNVVAYTEVEILKKLADGRKYGKMWDAKDCKYRVVFKTMTVKVLDF